MKRTPLRRTAPKLRRSRLRQLGKRAGRDLDERKAFKEVVRDRVLVQSLSCDGFQVYRCERCAIFTKHIEAHHLCPRARSVGHEWKHSAERNGCGLCATCHNEVEHGTPTDRSDFIKPRRWLDAGGRLQTEENTR